MLRADRIGFLCDRELRDLRYYQDDEVVKRDITARWP